MPIRHSIEQGETIIQLSEEHGLFAETIWNDAANAALKEQRNDMNILLPGDEVVIPDIRPKSERLETLQRHRFRRKGIPAKFRLQVFDVEEPRANQEFILEIDGIPQHGTTDDQGIFEVFLPADAQKGKLVIGPDQFFYPMQFGHLDPITELVGVQKRLSNLGYDCGEADGTLNSTTRRALETFQYRFELAVTGEADEATVQKLEEIYDQANTFPDAPDEEDA